MNLECRAVGGNGAPKLGAGAQASFATLLSILMQPVLRILLVVGLVWVGPLAHAYRLHNRWSTTATDGSTGARGNPITLTWGIVADGTFISGTEGSSASNLISFLDTQIGGCEEGSEGCAIDQRPWFHIFESSFGRLAELSGVTYVYEPNNSSSPINASNFPTGQLNSVPDIRIGGHSIDGSSGANTLAYSYFPNNSDLVLDTDNANFFGNSVNNYRPFRNILMHEGGHGLGINHLDSSNARFLMEPILNNNFDGPQLDDILALQRNYGDALEKNGGNDVFSTATMLGSLVDATTLSIGTRGDSLGVQPSHTDFVSIDGVSDIDFFSFTLTRTLDVTLNLTPRGAIYNEGPQGGTQVSTNTKTFSDLTLALFDTDGTTLIEQANHAAAGLAESLTRQLAPGTYYARVTGANDNVQLYGLDVTGSRVAAHLLWTGLHSGDWQLTTTENFADEVGPVPFYAQDHVTFDDTAATFHVNLAESVQPASITVHTAGAYTFTGAGGILDGALTLTGGGTLELANDGNAYAGTTEVQQGTLIVVTATGTGDTTVYGGANLAGSGIVGGNLNALSGSTVLPGSHLVPPTTNIEQDATLTVDGDFSQQLGAVLEMQLRSVADFDALIVTGSTSLEGTLSIQLAEGFTAAPGDRFDIMSSIGGIAGTFSELVLPDLGDLLAFDAIYEPHTVALTVVPLVISQPGDFNGDGLVDGRDFLAWQRGHSPDPFSATDLADWQAYYAPQGAALAAMSTSVPEPSTALTLVLGICITWICAIGTRGTSRD